MNISVTHKDILASGKPYPSSSADNYIRYLMANRDSIYSGNIGIYLARRVEFDGQSLFFPFIDVDADRDLVDENEKISSAIINLTLCYKVLKELHAE